MKEGYLVMTREEQYEEKRKKLEKRCQKCKETSLIPPSYDRCDYHCTIGRKIRYLESEYSDVTGWSHENWK